MSLPVATVRKLELAITNQDTNSTLTAMSSICKQVLDRAYTELAEDAGKEPAGMATAAQVKLTQVIGRADDPDPRVRAFRLLAQSLMAIEAEEMRGRPREAIKKRQWQIPGIVAKFLKQYRG